VIVSPGPVAGPVDVLVWSFVVVVGFLVGVVFVGVVALGAGLAGVGWRVATGVTGAVVRAGGAVVDVGWGVVAAAGLGATAFGLCRAAGLWTAGLATCTGAAAGVVTAGAVAGTCVT
jgi:hypothetical protein